MAAVGHRRLVGQESQLLDGGRGICPVRSGRVDTGGSGQRKPTCSISANGTAGISRSDRQLHPACESSPVLAVDICEHRHLRPTHVDGDSFTLARAPAVTAAGAQYMRLAGPAGAAFQEFETERAEWTAKTPYEQIASASSRFIRATRAGIGSLDGARWSAAHSTTRPLVQRSVEHAPRTGFAAGGANSGLARRLEFEVHRTAGRGSPAAAKLRLALRSAWVWACVPPLTRARCFRVVANGSRRAFGQTCLHSPKRPPVPSAAPASVSTSGVRSARSRLLRPRPASTAA